MLHFDSSTIETLRSNILPIIGRDVMLKQVSDKPGTKSFHEWRGPCPFCGGGTDRFFVRTDTRLFGCRNCGKGKGGDSIQYTMARHKLPFVDAVKLLMNQPATTEPMTPVTQVTTEPMTPEERANWQEALETIIPKAIHCLLDGDGPAAAARDWLQARGITREQIGQFGLGYNPHWQDVIPGYKLAPGLLIPRIRYGAYEAVNCYLDQATREQYGKRRMYLRGSNVSTWLNDLTVSLAQTVIICEGELDAVLLSRFIFPIAPEIAITTLGGANNTPDSLALAMLQDKSVILAFDNDQAGIKGEQRLQEHIAKNASPYVLDIAPKFPTGKDATDYYRAGGDLIAWLDSI